MSKVIAQIDLDQVSQYDETKPGIDFFNEIDIWTKMEFRSREQISRLRNKHSKGPGRAPNGPHSLYYSFRDE